jgi:uncharacterized membrane protein YkoI
MKRIAPALFAVLALAAAPVRADDHHDHDRVREAVEAGHFLPFGEILARAMAAYPGQLIEAELEDSVYEIKLLQEGGRLIKLHYDARSGELLHVKEGHRRR